MPENNLLSVSADAEHPNFVNPPKGECEAGRSGPLLTNGAESGALETRWHVRAAPPVCDGKRSAGAAIRRAARHPPEALLSRGIARTRSRASGPARRSQDR